jgi:hypothetical protein
MTQYVIAVEKSANAKTGPVSATYVAQASCPGSCPFLDGGGCYGESGMVGIHSARLNKLAGGRKAKIDPRVIARQVAQALARLTGTRPTRLNVVGDSRTNKATQIVAKAVARWTAKVWSYTHAWRTVLRDSWGAVSILASCETIADVKAAMSRGYAAAMVVDRHPDDGKAWTQDGITFIPCPAQTREDVTCMDCKLCWGDYWLLTTQRVITFAAHGSGQKAVKQQLIQIH